MIMSGCRAIASRRLEPLQCRDLADDDAVARVLEQVRDLVGREGVVDRERRRAEMDRCGVAEVELGTVRHQEANRVATADAESRQSGSDAAHAIGVFGPGQLDRPVGVAQGDLIRVALGARLELLAHRGRAGRRLGGRGCWLSRRVAVVMFLRPVFGHTDRT